MTTRTSDGTTVVTGLGERSRPAAEQDCWDLRAAAEVPPKVESEAQETTSVAGEQKRGRQAGGWRPWRRNAVVKVVDFAASEAAATAAGGPADADAPSGVDDNAVCGFGGGSVADMLECSADSRTLTAAMTAAAADRVNTPWEPTPTASKKTAGAAVSGMSRQLTQSPPMVDLPGMSGFAEALPGLLGDVLGDDALVPCQLQPFAVVAEEPSSGPTSRIGRRCAADYADDDEGECVMAASLPATSLGGPRHTSSTDAVRACSPVDSLTTDGGSGGNDVAGSEVKADGGAVRRLGLMRPKLPKWRGSVTSPTTSPEPDADVQVDRVSSMRTGISTDGFD